MATTATPMGAEPVGGLSACGSFSGKVRHIKIASGYAATIFYGDFVKLVNTGTVEKDTGTVASDAMAYVLDDPDAVFRMQANGSLAQTTLGNNIAIVQTAGTAQAGRSKNSVNASTAATTNTLPLRILEFMDGPNSTVGDAFTNVLLTYNEGMHQYRNATGV